jgi:hypothetical protein
MVPRRPDGESHSQLKGIGMTRLPRIGITMGDPAGIGAEIICRSLADLRPEERRRFVVFGDRALMQRANALVEAGLRFGGGWRPSRFMISKRQPWLSNASPTPGR